jgi:ribosomal protein S18 acetylase RimI-like enzyme
MLKKFNFIRVYDANGTFKIKRVTETVLDFAKEESMELWASIMNHDSCGIFVIKENGVWVGGAVVVTNSPKVNMLKGDMDNAVLWDIRVDSNHQNKGYGKMLFEKACNFAMAMGCKRMLIETQNNNPKAIEFYERQGATLFEINFKHYPDCPDEDQLIFELLLLKD